MHRVLGGHGDPPLQGMHEGGDVDGGEGGDLEKFAAGVPPCPREVITPPLKVVECSVFGYISRRRGNFLWAVLL
eukprot:1153262-Pyramimonas_sp.AAC.1